MGKYLWICLSSFQCDQQSSAEIAERPREDRSGSPRLANSSVVPDPPPSIHGEPPSVTVRRETVGVATGPAEGAPSEIETSSVQIIRDSLGRQGIQGNAADLILASIRKSTLKQYGTYIQKWLVFCAGRKSDPLCPPMSDILDFLTELYKKGNGYSAINTARSALSMIIISEDSKTTIGNDRWVKKLLKGIFQLRPALPKYNVTWDVSKVLLYLADLGTAKDLSLKLLSYKVIMLLALLSGQRSQTLHFIDLQNIEFRQNSLVIRIGDLVKQSRPGYHMSEMSIPEYSQDNRLCPIVTLKCYMERTKNIRGKTTKLFISCIKPHGPITKSTLSRWIKDTMSLAGINVNIFTPHSTRTASTSKAKVPLATILKTAGWAKDCTFRKYYKKPVCSDTDFGLSLLEATQTTSLT